MGRLLPGRLFLSASPVPMSHWRGFERNLGLHTGPVLRRLFTGGDWAALVVVLKVLRAMAL